jgi:malonyl-CoA/methylmalonyl-CoA synthetase
MPEKTARNSPPTASSAPATWAAVDADFYVTISGRSKDLVITGGLNVYPKEIEELIDALPGVVESAVIGLPHPDFGEAVTRRGGAPEERRRQGTDRGRHHRRGQGQLANFKVPKWVYLVDELPRNAMGKVQKNILRQEYSPMPTALRPAC